MDDRDFFDMMMAGMAKTTHAEDAYWGFEETEDVSTGWFYEEDPVTTYTVFAVTADQEKHPIGVFLYEEDAAFITAVHGAFPDIYRRLNEALDEADRLDLEKDMAENVAADLSDRLVETEARLSSALGTAVEGYHGKAVSG